MVSEPFGGAMVPLDPPLGTFGPGPRGVPIRERGAWALDDETRPPTSVSVRSLSGPVLSGLQQDFNTRLLEFAPRIQGSVKDRGYRILG